MTPVNLFQKPDLMSTHWGHHVVAEYNDIMVVKFRGSFPVRHHTDTDDFLLVLKGEPNTGASLTAAPTRHL